MKNLDAPLLYYPTNGGYSPKDFFSIKGKINIVKNYLIDKYINVKRIVRLRHIITYAMKIISITLVIWKQKWTFSIMIF